MGMQPDSKEGLRRQIRCLNIVAEGLKGKIEESGAKSNRLLGEVIDLQSENKILKSVIKSLAEML